MDWATWKKKLVLARQAEAEAGAVKKLAEAGAPKYHPVPGVGKDPNRRAWVWSSELQRQIEVDPEVLDAHHRAYQAYMEPTESAWKLAVKERTAIEREPLAWIAPEGVHVRAEVRAQEASITYYTNGLSRFDNKLTVQLSSTERYGRVWVNLSGVWARVVSHKITTRPDMLKPWEQTVIKHLCKWWEEVK